MAKKIIGTIPVARGEYNASANYYKENIVTMYGMTFRCTKNTIGKAPATLISGKVALANTDVWQLMCGSTDVYNVVTQVQDNANSIAETPSLTLRRLYIAAGAAYNANTGFYELNGVDNLSENDIAKIYNYKEIVYNLQAGRILQGVSLRALYPRLGYNMGQIYTGATAINGLYSFASTNLEVFNLGSTAKLDTVKTDEIAQCSTFYGMFYQCRKLHTIYPLSLASAQAISSDAFRSCESLKVVRLFKLPKSVSFADSPLIDKDSLLYMIDNASPKEPITITLHHDAYAWVAVDAEILAALDTKNAALSSTGSGKISLVCAEHEEEITPNI